MGQLVGAQVEVVVVLAFVDAHAPDDDGGVVPVAGDHAPDVLDALVLPAFAPDMLPAGDFLEHEEPEFVAAVEEIMALRIVRGAHHVELELALQYFRVALLRRLAQRIADIGEGLVPVEAAELERLAVELEALGGEFGRAEAEAEFCLVLPMGRVDGDRQRIERGIVDVPEADTGKAIEADLDAGAIDRRIGRGDRLAIRIKQRRDQRARERQVLRIAQRDAGPYRFLFGQRIGRLHLGIADKDRRRHPQPDFAIDAGIGEIVDLPAKGRNLGVFAAVDGDGQHILAVLELAGQPRLEGRIAVLVRRDFLAIEADLGIGHGAVEDNGHLFPLPSRVGGKAFLIGEDALVHLLVEIGEGQLHRIMRQADIVLALEQPAGIEIDQGTHGSLYLTAPSMPSTKRRWSRKKMTRVGRVAKIAPTMTTPKSGV